MTYHIRTMLAEDADNVAAIQVASWQAAYRGIIDDEILDNMNVADREKRWRKNLKEGGFELENIVCVSSKNNQIIGFASYGEERNPDDGTTGRGELWAIYVHPDAWGKGAGYQLWKHFDEHRLWYPKGSVVWVLSDNTLAIKFYERLGFKKDGATKDFTYQEKSFPELRMFL